MFTSVTRVAVLELLSLDLILSLLCLYRPVLNIIRHPPPVFHSHDCGVCVPLRSSIFSLPYSYLAYTLGSTPLASRIMMGMYGLFFFIVGYARVRNDLNARRLVRDRQLACFHSAQRLDRNRAVVHTGQHCCVRSSGNVRIAALSVLLRKHICLSLCPQCSQCANVKDSSRVLLTQACSFTSSD